ncbi:MAG: hypothetical protein WAN47_02750 [Nitrosotalea sp.]
MKKNQKVPKFSWGKTFEYNCGHNNNEWGMPNEEEEPNTKFIVAYAIKGKLSNVDTRGFLTSHLPTKISTD